MKNLNFIIGIFIIPLLFIGCQKDVPEQPSAIDRSSIHQSKLKTGEHAAYLQDLILQIEELVSQELLNKGNGNALIGKINAAIKSLDKNNSNAANGQLNALINQILAFVGAGFLTADMGQELIDFVQQAIDGDYTLWECGEAFPDERDGKAYGSVLIGNQCWMAENLAFLPEVSGSDLGSDDDPYYYVYGYEGADISAAKGTANFATYGVLYNWPAALFACPEGWHLPSISDWEVLFDNLGGESVAGGKMKETGTTHWNNPNTGAINSSSFTALPGGYRYWDEGFYGLGLYGQFWLSSPSPYESKACGRQLTHVYEVVTRFYDYQRSGFSVRCIKDTE